MDERDSPDLTGILHDARLLAQAIIDWNDRTLRMKSLGFDDMVNRAEGLIHDIDTLDGTALATIQQALGA